MPLTEQEKQEAIKNTLDAYAGDIEGSITSMSKNELIEYLSGDIFIGIASAATGIPEAEFVDFAADYLPEKQQ